MRPVLITGGAGTLGAAFARLCDQRGLARHVLEDRTDLGDLAALGRVLDHHQPWLVVHAATLAIDAAEADPPRCHRDIVVAAELLARACAPREVGLVAFSSPLVFDGASTVPYVETDPTAPLGVLGRARSEAEQRVLAACPAALVVRAGPWFGPWDDHNLVAAALGELAAGRIVRVARAHTVTPTYLPDLVHACLDLAIDGERGAWHLANTGATTLAELARDVARAGGHGHERVVEVAPDQLGWVAPRPRYGALGSARGALLPGLDDALRRYHLARSSAP